jgi:hypothetical protein
MLCSYESQSPGNTRPIDRVRGELRWIDGGPAMFDVDEFREQALNWKCDVNIGDWGIPVPRADHLTDITNKLGEARLEAEGLNDRFFLYLIDVAIFHAHEMLEQQSDLGEHEKWS